MAKKKKKGDGLREFIIEYSNTSGTHTANQRAIDKHDAILKFKQLNAGVRVKDAKEVVKPPELHGTTTGPLIYDEVACSAYDEVYQPDKSSVLKESE